MKNYRPGKNETEHYSSLADLGKAWGLKATSRKSSNEEKLKKDQEKFVGKCRVCGEQLSYVKDTNVIACTNVKCKGVKASRKNIDGTESLTYIPVTRLVDEKGMEIGMRLFA